MNLQVLEKGLVPIYSDENSETLVSGRELHEFLEIEARYDIWFDRMIEYGFAENIDFSVMFKNVHDDTAFGGKRKITDHAMKLDMAKELGMIQRTEKGRQVRKYFIEAEKRFKSNHIDFEKLSPELRMFANVFTSLAKIELEQNETKKLAQEANDTIKDIKATIITESEDWRKDVVKKIRIIAEAGKNYSDLQRESYRILEDKASCNLKQRLENKRMRALANGNCKSKVEQMNSGSSVSWYWSLPSECTTSTFERTPSLLGGVIPVVLSKPKI